MMTATAIRRSACHRPLRIIKPRTYLFESTTPTRFCGPRPSRSWHDGRGPAVLGILTIERGQSRGEGE